MTGKPPEVSVKRRWLLYASLWSAAALSFFLAPLFQGEVPGRDQILLLVVFSWLFPAGLSSLLGRPRPLDDIVLLAVFWLAYLLHGVFTLRSQNRLRFYILLAILAVVLSLNIVGCHTIKVSPRAFG